MKSKEFVHTFLDQLNWKYCKSKLRSSSGEIHKKNPNGIHPVRCEHEFE